LERGVVVSPAKLEQYLADQDMGLEDARCQWDGVDVDCVTAHAMVVGADGDILLTVQGG
jgi:hypothetical protein